MKTAEKIIETANKMEKAGLTRGTWGNISIREDDKIWITPSGLPYDRLKPENISIIDIASQKQIGGDLKASSELFLHLHIYKNFSNINGVVHTHSIYASTFAAANKPIPCYIEDQAQIIGGEIPVAKYAFPGTEELAENAIEELKTGVYGVLLSKHGAVGIGRTIEEAMIAAQIIEKSAQVAFLVSSIDSNAIPLSIDDIQKMREVYLNKYSSKIIEK